GGADIPLPGALASATGLPLDPQLLEKVVYELRDGYLAKGYTDVAVAYQQTEAAPKQVDIAITVTPGKASTVTAVAFKGNKKVAAAALDKTAAIAKGSPYSDDAIDRAMLALQTYYYDHGFVNVIIMPPKPAGGPGPATFEITEGDQFRVGAVTLTGIDDAKKYLAMLPLKKGDVFSRAAIQTGIEKIQTALQKRVEPVTHVDAAKHTIDLDLQVPKT
ncbi:MAG TPA: POTRA domain-containing protein, partial [Kofleriaceae bacterium]